ncbi:3-hydroxyisobutyrate dehydrogenase [Williamsia limnetica]|uniref:3-hydroxyisobutyrate dehydrogenase n=1 Tax=Williamsia limnetica TaxID=882452 RepID=A0A318R995_WILLI|nr:NAD(P)-dependent oxidoreductase [Williamsia limnetica]PYE12185.1 3-hydroxyisobutyrate dehydrogenase [Williamsia limnetica]
MSEQTAVGFIGLGNMGLPMAQKLAAWPGGLVFADLNPDVDVPGATRAGSAAEVAKAASVIGVTVLNDEQVVSVVRGPNGILETAAPGTVIAIHSTISPQTAVDLEKHCAEQGVALVDAPVSGGADGAKQGRLAIMVGGDREAYLKLKEPYGLMSDMMIHAGPVGAGTKMKLARNLLHFIAFTATTEASRLAEAAGVDIVKLGKVVRHTDAITGGAGAIMLRDSTAPIEPDDFWYDIFTHVRGLGEKDLGLALQLGAELGVELPLGEISLQRFADGLGVGKDNT